MKRIGLLSDTHAWLDKRTLNFFKDCDEIWHAGDIGSYEIAQELSNFKPFRAVYGNIDGYPTRSVYPEFLSFKCENVDVLMTHIGGYPGHYNPKALSKINIYKPRLFVCGHSHILKVIYDKTHQMLCMNPGAAGNQGFHQVRTALRFTINDNDIKDLEVLEIPRH